MSDNPSKLTEKKCAPCEGGASKLTTEQVDNLMPQIPGWRAEGDFLLRTFEFKDFKAAMAFLNQVADIAEAEGHHPDFRLHGWNKVDFEIQTHDVGGLSENDFILAAKIDEVA